MPVGQVWTLHPERLPLVVITRVAGVAKPCDPYTTSLGSQLHIRERRKGESQGTTESICSHRVARVQGVQGCLTGRKQLCESHPHV